MSTDLIVSVHSILHYYLHPSLYSHSMPLHNHLHSHYITIHSVYSLFILLLDLSYYMSHLEHLHYMSLLLYMSSLLLLLSLVFMMHLSDYMLHSYKMFMYGLSLMLSSVHNMLHHYLSSVSLIILYIH